MRLTINQSGSFKADLKQIGEAGRRLGQHVQDQDEYLGLSENSVPLHPMVNDHYPY